MEIIERIENILLHFLCMYQVTHVLIVYANDNNTSTQVTLHYILINVSWHRQQF